MRQNTGCGSNSQSCPSLEPCGNAEVVRVDCDFEDFKPRGVKLDVPVLDVHVPLAEVMVEADIEAIINLPQNTFAREIKVIRKNVSITQCKAVQSSKGPKHVKLFISGIVHKNIQFIDSCDGVIRDHNVDVPFTCVHKVKLRNPIRGPWGKKGVQFSSKASDAHEIRELAKNGHEANRCISGSKTTEVFNEPIECKLLAAEIREMDIFENFDQLGRFNSITEKMEVTIWIKLLQMQQVKFDPTPDFGRHHFHSKKGKGHEFEESSDESSCSNESSSSSSSSHDSPISDESSSSDEY